MHVSATVQIGTRRMIEKGIMARAIVDVAPAEGKDPIFQFNNVLIRKKDDELWVAMPAEMFTVNTEEGEKRRWKAIVKVGPKEGKRNGDDDTPIQDKFHALVLKAYNEAKEQAKTQQTTAEPEPAVAPTDQGELDF